MNPENNRRNIEAYLARNGLRLLNPGEIRFVTERHPAQNQRRAQPAAPVANRAIANRGLANIALANRNAIRNIQVRRLQPNARIQPRNEVVQDILGARIIWRNRQNPQNPQPGANIQNFVPRNQFEPNHALQVQQIINEVAPVQPPVTPIVDLVEEDDDAETSEPLSMHTSYMEKLFSGGTGSDFTIEFKSESFEDETKTMKLHKAFICQMSYFEALFGAQWAESDRNSMEINLNDENITEKSLEIVFKSLYTGKLDYKKTEDDLISILATARFFSLDSVADTVAQIMFSKINIENAVYFYYSFGSYGYPQKENEVFLWILHNIAYWNKTKNEAFNSKVLAHIEENLMEKLLTHENLIVRNEMTLYNILKRWVVDKMKLRDDYDFFKIWNRPVPFLETEEGKQFENIFGLLNLEQICMRATSIEQLKKDNIFPASALNQAGSNNYLRLMQLSNPRPDNNIHNFKYRFAIFSHLNNDMRPILKETEVYGFHLKIRYSNNVLYCQRVRVETGLTNFAKAKFRLRVNSYSPEVFKFDEPKTEIFEKEEGEILTMYFGDEDIQMQEMVFIDQNPRVVGVELEFVH